MYIEPAEIFSGEILIVAPHMDDEMLACGGTMALLPDKTRIHLIYATDGMKSPAPIVPWRDEITADLGEVRIREARAALDLIGVPLAQAHFLRLPEARLQLHMAELGRCLVELVEKIQPDKIFMPFRYDRHPDHLAVNQVLTNAYRQRNWRSQLIEYFVYYRWRLLPGRDVRSYIKGDKILAIDTSGVAGIKRQALDCFRSQTTRFFSWQTRPILTPVLLDDTCRTPEFFLPFDPAFSGAAVFKKAVFWIRFVHRVEPYLQKSKYLIGASLNRLRGGGNGAG